MEISKTGDTSIKIKLKKLNVVIDPPKKIDAEVAIVTNDAFYKTLYEEYPLIIDGPGEYEKGGVYIKGKKIGKDTSYEISDSGQVVRFAPSTVIDALKEEGAADVTVVAVTNQIDEKIFSAFSESILVLYGAELNLELDSEVIKSLSRVNLKNREEYRGSVILLTA